MVTVPLVERLDAIVTFAFDESKAILGTFEVEAFVFEPELVELAVSEELELASTLEA
ncbi:hypothetical protein AB996_1956 [Lactococcus cremoris]|uniref:Uncharacterized protein n=1 Tax=Lactococcus lactis subsp. cremoris TaxID=1359 RepID=A0A166J0U2_LACLC|nr:hypothetical protein AB996_1956 [Lactococcus cremoris]